MDGLDPLKILIVEDNPGDLTLMNCYLNAALDHPHLLHANSFTLARQMLIEGQCSIDLIFLDLSLPEVEAETLIDEILVLCPDLPIIVMSGYVGSRYGEKSLKKGVAAYLIKEDITPSMLQQKIGDCMALKKH